MKPVALPHSIETPSGKGASGENFPVGSWLLAKELRPHVATYYRFARAIDDIADNPDLTSEGKLARLTAFEAAVLGRADSSSVVIETAAAMRRSLAETGISPQRCTDLIAAFKRDAVQDRYRSWDELLGYCRLSADPVGRYLLDLHGEDPAGYPASDALCSALQILNHLQDCRDDYLALNRVYLPLGWLSSEGTGTEALGETAASPQLRRVLDRCLDGVESLLAEAAALPPQLHSVRLAMESAVILRLARRLAVRLRKRDPLAARVALARTDFAVCGLRGPTAVCFDRLLKRKADGRSAAKFNG